MKYNLVCTKVKDIVSSKQELLILDYFCLDNLVDSYFEKNFNIANSYGYDEKIMEVDLEVVKKLVHSLMIELSKILNEEHKINYTIRKWEILFSFWLHRTICVLFNRFKKIEKTFNENSIQNVTIYKNEIYDLVNYKTNDIGIKSRNLYWNNIIYDEIIKFKKFKVNMNYVKSNLDDEKFYVTQNSFTKKIKSSVKYLINNINKKKVKNSKSLIFESCLTKKDNKKLLNFFKQPIIYVPDYVPDSNEVNHKLREEISKKLDKKINNEFEKFVKEIIFKIFPMCFLENFEDLKSKCSKCVLPVNPKFIFTSNAFDVNETFKMYLCQNLEKSKYFAGQHGGATPVSKYGVLDSYLFDQVDGFFNWGWANQSKNYSSFLLPKLTIQKKSITNKKKISIMLGTMMHQNVTWDRHEEALFRFKKYVELIKNSKKFDFHKRLFVKFYPQVSCKINNVENFKKYAQIENYDEGNIEFDDYKDECDLNIFNGQSTGFFQLININKPTLGLFHSFNKDIKDIYKDDFKKLAKVGVVHFNNQTLINFLNDIYKNIPDWWNSSDVQEALMVFRKKYASNNKDFKFLIEKMKF